MSQLNKQLMKIGAILTPMPQDVIDLASNTVDVNENGQLIIRPKAPPREHVDSVDHPEPAEDRPPLRPEGMEI